MIWSGQNKTFQDKVRELQKAWKKLVENRTQRWEFCSQSCFVSGLFGIIFPQISPTLTLPKRIFFLNRRFGVSDNLVSPSVAFIVYFFCCVPDVLHLHEEEEFCCLQRRSKGLFSKMALVLPCIAVHATYEQVSFSREYLGRFPVKSQVLVKYPTEA